MIGFRSPRSLMLLLFRSMTRRRAIETLIQALRRNSFWIRMAFSKKPREDSHEITSLHPDAAFGLLPGPDSRLSRDDGAGCSTDRRVGPAAEIPHALFGL